MRNKALIAVIAASAFVFSAQSAMADITTTLLNVNVTKSGGSTNNQATSSSLGSANSNAVSSSAGAGNTLISDDCQNCGHINTDIKNVDIIRTGSGNNTATVDMRGGSNLASAGAGSGNISIKRAK